MKHCIFFHLIYSRIHELKFLVPLHGMSYLHFVSSDDLMIFATKIFFFMSLDSRKPRDSHRLPIDAEQTNGSVWRWGRDDAKYCDRPLGRWLQTVLTCLKYHQGLVGLFACCCTCRKWVSYNVYLHWMGLLPDKYNCGLRMHRECWERFPATDFKGHR